MAHDARHDDVPAVFGMKHLKSLPMHEITVGELRDYMLKGDLTSVDYVNYCLERIHRVCAPSRQLMSPLSLCLEFTFSYRLSGQSVS